ncbi:MAG: hypothetical protein ACK2U5_15890 [Candidatus Promineifilaceae bacterium]|jgi:hypothetical protein
MSKLTWLIAIVFFIHGIGHIMCILPALGLDASPTWNSYSWLLTNLIGQKAANVVGIIIWLAAIVGFLLAALALLGWGVPYVWWRPLAVVSAVISLIGVILFWNAFASWFNKAGAITVDLAVLVGLLVLHWPAEQQLIINS